MINLGQMTTSSSSSTGGRVGQGTNDRGSRASSSQQDPTKKSLTHCFAGTRPTIKSSIKERHCLIRCLLPFIIHTFDQWHSDQFNRGFSFWNFFQFIKCSEKNLVIELKWHFLHPCLRCKKCSPAAPSTVCLAARPTSALSLVETGQSEPALEGSWVWGVEGMSRVCPDLVLGSIICSQPTF